MRTSKRTRVLWIAIGLACVPSEQYESTLSELGSSRNTLAEAQKALGQCQEDNARLEQQASKDTEAIRAELEDELRRLHEANEKRAQAFADLRRKLQNLIDAGELEVYERRGRISVSLPTQVLFPSGKADLSKKGETALTTVGGVLKQLQEQRIEVAGHTDDVPIGEKLEFIDNWELSTARALTVTRFLVALGVEPRLLGAAGYGEFDPVASNDNANGRKRNRRIELILVPDLSALPTLLESTG